MANIHSTVTGSKVLWYDVTETAAFIRKSLKATFPTTKFSVKCDRFSGGTSIDISWTDGPTDPEVSRVIAEYRCYGFDSSTDCQTQWNQERDGMAVRYGGTFIHTKRSYSADFLKLAIARVNAQGRFSLKAEDVVQGRFDAYFKTNNYDEQSALHTMAHTMRPNGISINLKAGV